ncbi:MAG TPA: efflux RND transporter periplasmic adaptor subunit, partial [Burkholderiales bacterium]|nr:efflux RND transporter periplasmic adaptor subunit [Burkholderiales bacterium]
GQPTGFDGVVEAVRQTVLAAQVAGAVTALHVKVGDVVKTGQLLARMDAQAAVQNAAASDAQVHAARASLDLARKEFERQKQLYQKDYISQAALERAEAQLKSAQAQVTAMIAQANATRAHSGFFLVNAPYTGIVSEVPVALGDMAMPGKPLLTLYDPAAMRVTVAVPQSVAARLVSGTSIKIQLPELGAAREWVAPSRVQVLPTSDASTHTAQVRLELPQAIPGIKPGMFARAWLPEAKETGSRLDVPASAIVRRAEMTGLYVIGADGRPLLRQVRLGRQLGDSIEVLSGVAAGERVALDPQAAARIR